jgi:hexosaminidase
MKLSIIPAPGQAEYLPGFTKTDAEIIFYEDTHLPPDAFTIHINGNIRIGTSSDSGCFYANNTLDMIKYQCGQNLPNVHIRDIPKYTYRSFMIDSCRHFFDVSDIKKMIDYCAKLRFNVFHWHLTDDQGWRVEIKNYPSLTQIGSVRHGTHMGSEQNNTPYGGFYTQDEIRDVVSYAHKNHMTVVPEIDMPGHTSAILASLPELACNSKEVKIKTEAGIFKDIICAGNDNNYDILYNILDEICKLFPDDYIHIGGDEAPKEQWKNCPCCQNKIKNENLKNEEELQGYFINRINSYLRNKGKKVITWNESLNGGNLDKDITVQMWMDPMKRSKASENKIINSDFYHMYTDYPYAMTPLKKVYEYNTDINNNVIGTDIPIWTEYIPDLEKMEYMCFPRFIAAAQAAWSTNKPSYNVFKSDLIELLPFFGIENAAKKKSGILSHQEDSEK